MGTTLNGAEIGSELAKLPGWQFANNSLQRELTFKDFAEAMIFVNRVAEIAEELNHHPDITIRWNKVGLVLSSHDSGGVTRRDLTLATRITQLREARADAA